MGLGIGRQLKLVQLVQKIVFEDCVAQLLRNDRPVPGRIRSELLRHDNIMRVCCHVAFDVLPKPALSWEDGEATVLDNALDVDKTAAGLAAALVDADVSWSETVSIAGRRSPAVAGAGHNTQVLWGFYLGANAAYQFSERWSAILGVQFQDVGTYSHSFSGRQVDADLGSSVFVTAGLGWNF